MNNDLSRKLGGFVFQKVLDQMEIERREAIRLGLFSKPPLLPATSDIRFVKRVGPRFIDPVIRVGDPV